MLITKMVMTSNKSVESLINWKNSLMDKGANCVVRRVGHFKYKAFPLNMAREHTVRAAIIVDLYSTRISGRYAPLILAPAEAGIFLATLGRTTHPLFRAGN